MNTNEKIKKPIWKKWWFWFIAFCVVAGTIGATQDKDKINDKKVAKEETVEKKEKSDTKKEVEKKEEKPAPKKEEKPKITTYKEGMYKIGTDLAAGDYYVKATSTGYFQISSDSTGALTSIIANDNFSGNAIVTVTDGQYLEVKRAVIIPLAEAPAPSGDQLKDGMYRVGVDLPAGEYKVTASGMGYIQISSDLSHSILSIVSNDNFDGEKYITVADGQFLTLKRATLNLK